MSDALGFNKIAGCVLATGLALIGLNEASHALFPETHHQKEGYVIEIPTTPEGGETVVAEGPRDYFKLISNADPIAGKLVSAKCKQCHDFEPNGKVVTGPPLYGIVGRQIASFSGSDFKYSTGAGSMTEHAFAPDGVWTYEHLDHYLERPKKLVPGTAMNFMGLKKQEDRSNIIAWLRTQTAGEPLPLPPPLPEQPAAPAEGAVPPANGATPPGGAAPTPGAPTTPGQPAPAAPAPATPAQPAPH